MGTGSLVGDVGECDGALVEHF
ncbi:uncharacterized protein G2W53_025145 [Senna tora]|uniref:Uncharacterized protein n=1 Tax=Senna tora TaxID=362788 RepID=A0A834TD99_9FABA|nr:uncharacterized protein G2W53_025145 [Senna tora]